jgi:diadenosine tetraphosphate (Ap4A) HIT family hydrolase
MNFQIDEKISNKNIFLGDTQLAAVFLKNNKNFPWIILVPKRENLSELTDLSRDEWLLLQDDINLICNKMQQHFKIEKFNIANLGNIVNQLHIHIVGRNSNDLAWPNGVWQASIPEQPYTNEEADKLTASLGV